MSPAFASAMPDEGNCVGFADVPVIVFPECHLFPTEPAGGMAGLSERSL